MNHQKSAIESIHEITKRILAVSTPRKIILFGSCARGDYDSGSDLDILVILDEVDSIQEETKRLYQALFGLGVPVDIVVARTAYVQRYGDLIGSVVRPALVEGKVLYAR
jgi:predicted nucleotidyltransferase